MRTFIFDIETNGLLDATRVVHSLVIKNHERKIIFSCADQEGYTPIKEGLKILQNATRLAGHNIIKFDLPALKRVYPDFETKAEIVDTLLLSRMLLPDIEDGPKVPPRLRSKHSLEAWGYRLDCQKKEFKDGFEKWSKKMQEYCEQDIEVTEQLYDYLMSYEPTEHSIKLETDFQRVIFQQELNGFPFDIPKAQELSKRLLVRKEELFDEVKKTIPDKVEIVEFTPKVNRPDLGYIKNVTVKREIVTKFNPSSRTQVIEYFKSKGWVPTVFTDKNNPQINDEVLRELPYPEAKPLASLYEVSKILGYVSEGSKAWLKLVKNGRLHGGVITNGAVTGRVTHLDPNLGQIPSVKTDTGKACRELFYAPDPYVMVGADLGQIELRLLGHYLYGYDGGHYLRIVEDGDIHTANQEAAGLQTRDDAKRFVYSFVYGAGDEKLGLIIRPNASKEEQKRIGGEAKRSFLSKMPAIHKLMSDVKSRFNARGYLVGLDGRRLTPRKEYSALNTLIQGAGAVVAKTWNVEFHKDRLFHVEQLAFVHDEIQAMCLPEHTDSIRETFSSSANKTGLQLGLYCKIIAETKVSKTWAGTH